jgi:gliding motility-associated lipoprotein GldB
MNFNKINIMLVLLFLLLFLSCNSNDKLAIDVSNIKVDTQILRFDQDYYGTNPDSFYLVKQKYPYLFPSKTPDSIWIAKMQDSMFLSLKKQVNSVFSNMETHKNQIDDLFKHIKYYHSGFITPKIITLYSDWNYLRRAVYADSLELLTLDNFLGTNNTIYKGIPGYIRQNLVPERIPVEIANSIIETQVKPSKSKSFLARMVNAGKKMYLLDAYLPKISDSLKIGYSKLKMQWANENEEFVWKYFISNDLLYSTDSKLDMRFMNLAPYSKFYTEADSETPGRLGQYIGWQIVRSFMKKNEVSLQELINLPEEEIFNKSKYKPNK